MLNLIFILSIACAYIKIPLELSQKSDSSQEDSAVARYYNIQYSAIFQVGTPPQPMSLSLDTGSSWIWIPSISCKCHQSKNAFNSSASSSYWDLGVNHVLEYKETEKKVIGSLGLESFSISDFTADYQLFVLAFKDSGFDNLNSDGFLGLGFNLLS